MVGTSSTMRGLRTPAPRRSKTSEKQPEAQDSPAKLVLDGNDKCTRQKPLSRLGHRLRKKLEQERPWRYVLINEHNRLTLAVKEKEDKLKELQESIEAMTDQPTYNDEDTLRQHIRQLENNREKMKIKVTEGQKIQVAYHHIFENLQREVLDMCQVLDRCEVAVEQAQADTATKMLQSVEDSADSTPGKILQVENGNMEKRRAMASELYEMNAALKELKKQMETFRRLSPRGQSRLKERESDEEEPHSVSVKDHQCNDIYGASGCDMKQVELLSDSADIQVVSQQTATQKLVAELTHQDELIGQETKTLADLELQYSELKFSDKSSATRCDKLKKQIQAKLKLEVKRVEQIQANLKQSQNLLDTVQQGVDNLYLRISSMSVKGLSSVTITDCIDKLRDISVLLPTLLQSSEISSLNQEEIFNLLENFSMMELRNNKRPTSPTGTLQVGDDKEVCSPSRDEIKCCSIRLIESQQSKKSSRRTRL